MQRAKEAVSAALSAAVGEGEDEPPQEPDTDLGHADVPPAHPPPHPPLNHHAGQGAGHERHLLHLPGPLERVRETAVHAVQDVKHRLHLDGGEPTAEQRTGEAMHMAKAAEGRNKVEDDPIQHAIHDALKPERGERPTTSAFPETLGDALAVAQMRDLPTNNPSIAVEVAARSTAARETAAAVSVAADGGGGGTNDASELEAPNPFAVEERRSKL